MTVGTFVNTDFRDEFVGIDYNSTTNQELNKDSNTLKYLNKLFTSWIKQPQNVIEKFIFEIFKFEEVY